MGEELPTRRYGPLGLFEGTDSRSAGRRIFPCSEVEAGLCDDDAGWVASLTPDLAALIRFATSVMVNLPVSDYTERSRNFTGKLMKTATMLRYQQLLGFV